MGGYTSRMVDTEGRRTRAHPEQAGRGRCGRLGPDQPTGRRRREHGPAEKERERESGGLRGRRQGARIELGHSTEHGTTIDDVEKHLHATIVQAVQHFEHDDVEMQLFVVREVQRCMCVCVCVCVAHPAPPTTGEAKTAPPHATDLWKQTTGQ